MSRHRLQLNITRQPDDTTCGPTCLAAVHRFFGDPVGVEQADVDRLIAAVLLGVLTYDANLLQLAPGRRSGRGAHGRGT